MDEKSWEATYLWEQAHQHNTNPETQATLNRESHERDQRIHDMNQTTESILHIGGKDARWPLINEVLRDTDGYGNRSALSQAAVDYLCEEINYRSSPEVIHCDGEISQAEANKRWKAVNALALELKIYCKISGLRMTELHELD